MGRVYVTGFLDDCSNYRVESGAYLHKGVDESLDALRHALAKGRVPREKFTLTTKDSSRQRTSRRSSQGITLRAYPQNCSSTDSYAAGKLYQSKITLGFLLLANQELSEFV